MAASFIVAIGLVVLHAFATAVLWFEFRSREQRSIERIDKATAAVLGAIAALRGDLAPVLGGGPGGGGAPPLPTLPAVERSTPSSDPPPRSGRRVTDPPDSPPPVTRRSVAPGDAQAARTTSSRPPPPVVVEDAPTSAEIAAAYHREADAKDARDAAPEAHRDAAPPPAPTGDAAVAARFQGPAPGEDEATIRKPAPAADEEGWDRDTGEEGTRVWGGRVPVKRPPPHAPPRRTLLGGLAGAPLERPVSSAKRAAADFAARTGDKRDRDTLTPTEPSIRPLDARVRRRWAELAAAEQERGNAAEHCHGTLCMRRGEETALCGCHCDGCGLLLELLVRAERNVLGE